MTTKVTVEVPEGVNYSVAIKTRLLPLPPTITVLQAGERTEIYIHDGLRIVGIEEFLPSGLSKCEAFTNPAPHSDMKVEKGS